MSSVRALSISLLLTTGALCACHTKPSAEETAPGGQSLTSTPPASAPAGTPTPAAANAAKPPIDWNDSTIAWKSFDDGLAEAKAEKKPALLLFYADWCPHCRNYGQVFRDPKVIEKAKQFVMIRVNVDQDPAIDGRFGPEGNYVPRTFFLKPNGDVREDVHMKRDKFIHFYDEHSPAPLLRDMALALKES